MSQPKIVTLAGVPIHVLSEAETVARVLDGLEVGRGGWIVTPNLDIVRLCAHEVELADMVKEADLRVADGMPLVWASKVLGTPFPERVSGSNLISSLTAGLAERGRSIYLLGGMPGVADKAAEVLRGRHPGLDVRGTFCPEFGFEKDPVKVAEIREAVAGSGADVVFVALGFPKGERLTHQIRSCLPGAWWVGVGISFSFLAGDVARAPVWMQRTGTEWIHRLLQEPGRLAERYLVHDLPFAARLFSEVVRRRALGDS